MHSYIIHERPFNDSKCYVVLFSKKEGVQSTSIPNKKNIHYFTQYQVLSQKKLSLQHPIEPTHSFIGKRLYCGLYLNELIYRFCKPYDPHPELFDHYKNSLAALKTKTDIHQILRHFELSLLTSCGYGIDIHHIQTPYVSFHKHEGFIGSQHPSHHTIKTQDLQNMVHNLIPSEEVKYFFRHVLRTLLSSSLQSSLFYEKML